MRAIATTLNPAKPIEIRDMPDPVPARNEAVVAVHCFSLNRGELASFARNGVGWIPGQDIAGVVLKQAADGSGPPVGTRVVCLIDQYGWAEQAAVPAQRLVPLPDNVSFAAACTLPVAGITALRCVRLGGAIAGRRVLVTGAAGGVGMLAIQIAALSGARVTAVVGSASRAQGLAELGAHEIVEGIENASGKFSLILEAAGGKSLAEALKRIEPKGTIAVYGNSSGERTEIGFMDFRPAQNACIQSFFYFTCEADEMFAPDIALMVSMIANGQLKPLVGIERDWSELLAVGEMLRDRQVMGKAVFHTGIA